MASDRIGKTAANLVAVPPYEIVSVDTNHLFEQPQVMENIEEVTKTTTKIIRQIPNNT